MAGGADRMKILAELNNQLARDIAGATPVGPPLHGIPR